MWRCDMNKQIKELILQVGGIGRDDEGNELTPMLVGNEVEQFAQLIMQKCLSMIELEAAQYDEPVWAFEIVNDIKECFGVEE